MVFLPAIQVPRELFLELSIVFYGLEWKGSHTPDLLASCVLCPFLPAILLDYITGLPDSEGNTVNLTVVDQFTKMAHFVPLPKLPSAKEMVVVMLTQVFCRHSYLRDVVSDQGPQFSSRFWREFCQLVGATFSLSSRYHPQSNCRAEPETWVLPLLPCLPQPGF